MPQCVGPLAIEEAVGTAYGCNGAAWLGTLPPLVKFNKVLEAGAAEDEFALSPLYMVPA